MEIIKRRWLAVMTSLGAMGCLGQAMPVELTLGSGVLILLGMMWAEGRRRSSLPVMSLWLWPLLGVGLSYGTPSLVRVTYAVGLGFLGYGLLRWLERRPVEQPLPDKPGWVILGLILLGFILGGLQSWAIYQAGDRFMAQDTAYFEQCLWGWVNGRHFLMGSSQQWWLYDPPLTTHFAMHLSPLLLAVGGIYALFPSYVTLQVVQALSVTLACFPLYLLVRARSVGAAWLWCGAYLAQTAVWSQALLGFHELALAAPGVSWATAGLLTRRWRWLMGGLILAMLAREDLALLALMAGCLGVLRPGWREKLRWGLFPLLLGGIGWVGAGVLMRAWGASGGQVILSLFAHFGDTPVEIAQNMLLHPLDVVRFMLEGNRLHYVLELLAPGLLGALGNPVSLLVLPAVSINLLVRGAATAWPDVHYSVYLPPVLMQASVMFWQAREETLARKWSVPLAQWRLALPLLGLLSALTATPNVLPQRIGMWRTPPDREELLQALAHVPSEAPLAAPRHALPWVAQREQLFIVNRVAAYTRWSPEYILVDAEPDRVGLADGSVPSYQAYVERLASTPGVVQLWSGQYYRLYRDPSAGQQSLPLPQEAEP